MSKKYTEHLDILLDRLMTDNLSEAEMQKNINIAKAIVPIANVQYNAEKLKLQTLTNLVKDGYKINNETEILKELGVNKD